MNDKKKKDTTESVRQSEKEYPGVAIDRGDDDVVNSELVKERTKTLGYNPRDYK